MPTPPPNPKPLMALVTGFWAAKTLAVAHDMDLFTRLSGTHGILVEEFADEFGLHPRPAELLLSACAGLGLLRREGEYFANTALSEEYLVRGKPFYFGGWVEMADRREYPGWMKLEHALRTNRPTTWDADRQAELFEPDDVVLRDTFWDAMYSLSINSARAFADAVDLTTARSLLDVGGGGGAHAIALCQRYPQLRVTVFDLPFVCALTEPKVGQADVGARVSVTAGDFITDEKLPWGHDAVLLSMVLHDWDEPECRRLLAKCFDCLPPEVRLIITELLVNDTKDGPVDATLMSLNMLIETRGRNYTAAEYRGWLAPDSPTSPSPTSTPWAPTERSRRASPPTRPCVNYMGSEAAFRWLCSCQRRQAVFASGKAAFDAGTYGPCEKANTANRRLDAAHNTTD